MKPNKKPEQYKRDGYYEQHYSKVIIESNNDFNYPALITWVWKKIYWCKPSTQSWAEYYEMTNMFINGLCDLIDSLITERFEAQGGLEEFITRESDDSIERRGEIENLKEQIKYLKCINQRKKK